MWYESVLTDYLKTYVSVVVVDNCSFFSTIQQCAEECLHALNAVRTMRLKGFDLCAIKRVIACNLMSYLEAACLFGHGIGSYLCRPVVSNHALNSVHIAIRQKAEREIINGNVPERDVINAVLPC